MIISLHYYTTAMVWQSESTKFRNPSEILDCRLEQRAFIPSCLPTSTRSICSGLFSTNLEQLSLDRVCVCALKVPEVAESLKCVTERSG